MSRLSLHIGSEISLKDFSFSQLIIAVKDLFATEGIPGFVKVLITLFESTLINAGLTCPHCNTSKGLHRHGTRDRKVKTTVGEVVLNLTRIQCLSCKKIFVPFYRFLDLDRRSRKSREFEKLSLETSTNQSFRRTAKNLEDTLGFKTSFSTIHRWFQNTDATEIDVQKKVDTLIADGTGFKRDKKDKFDTNRGEIKVLIGYNKDGSVVPFGAWTQATWKDIGKYIKHENHPSCKIKFNPIANVLVTDGEEDIVRSLKKLAMTHQRCLFHMTHELVPLLKYKDNASKEEALKQSKTLNELLYIELPDHDGDPLKSLEDKLKIEKRLFDMKKSVNAFIDELRALGYNKAKNFVENARDQLFTYIENWIKTGIVNPKVTSLVERIMREIKRRIKRIGYKWSEKGAEKMTRLVLLQLSSTKQYWETHWKEKMGINANIKLTFLGVTVDQI